ncbi:phosphatase PAP2 family protein [Streptococcus macacae]|uniref:PAP2 family protein n=1 Tax=Streptococcus macacae NCTC 11558 TaxID=764298 RepID=G5JZ49_9STRE|nr:phosphatase PAP2 family protein [Streptococcus macacae]EHJ51906.1 PAP2 family protein [Streptococcus macacae NCTC 11558]SUN78302.1 lipid phosphate phosphohydrolase 2 family protein [Streptococcus macacae NCTC 11558]
MKQYDNFYERQTAFFRNRPRAIFWLRLANSMTVKLMSVVYAILLTAVFKTRGGLALLPYLLLPSISFIALSLVRIWLNQPRPYEVWQIKPLIVKETKGKSMPSRHVFSATMISMCVLHENLTLGAVLLLVSALLAFCRVWGGVHYPKDVIAGYMIGLAAGGLLFLF